MLAGLLAAGLRPLPGQHPKLESSPHRLLGTRQPLLRHRRVGRPLYVEDVSPAGQERAELPPLEAPDFRLVGAYGERGRPGWFARSSSR